MISAAEYIVGSAPSLHRRHLVVVSGCSGGGKSTLLDEMAQRGYDVVQEPGRQIVREQLQLGGDALPWGNSLKFAEFCVSRGMHQYNMSRLATRPVLFDRSILDNICGIERACGAIPESMLVALANYRYAPRVFLVPPWQELFAADAERRHSFEDASNEYAALTDFYSRHGYRLVIVPKASVSERVAFLVYELAQSDEQFLDEDPG